MELTDYQMVYHTSGDYVSHLVSTKCTLFVGHDLSSSHGMTFVFEEQGVFIVY